MSHKKKVKLNVISESLLSLQHKINDLKRCGLVPLRLNQVIKVMGCRTQDLYHPIVFGARIVIAHK
jgi:hypothetical protein